MLYIRLLFVLTLCASALSGCISMPESERELVEGRQEQLVLRDVSTGEMMLINTMPKHYKVYNLEDFYSEIGFNPKGENLYMVAFKDPIGANYARSIRLESVDLVKKLFPNMEAVDDKADAFRHTYFSFRLSQKIGTERAKKFCDAYEISNINKIGSRCMDLWNNREGRRLFYQSKGSVLSNESLQLKILEKMKNGDIAVAPFELRF